MSYGRLFLAGDAAHIVPPTRARGLNSAASDIHYLHHDHARALSERRRFRPQRLFGQGARADLEGATLFLVDDDDAAPFPDRSDYEDRLQQTELEYLFSSETAQRLLAENYVGLPF